MIEQQKKALAQVQISRELSEELRRNTTNVAAFKEKIYNSLQEDTSTIFDIIIAGSISLKASDIHIEPGEEESRLRVRLDGVLQDVINLDKNIYKKIASRIKLLSGVKLNVENKPQDGSFSISIPIAGEEVFMEIRMSSLPSEYGETLVLRILDPRKLITLEEFGLRSDILEIFKKEIKKPNGMIIVTGPTGSGKTTTLYAFLKTLRDPSIKIITIEDPIEYHLDGVSQTEVHADKGYDFASGLRAIVRQDPDVILVGEIRDLETIQISIQAALTGHLVFSTLHTNDAPGVVARMQSLGEAAVNISPAINIIIAQRLIRKVCPSCLKTEKIPEELLSEIKKEMSSVKEDIFSFPENPEQVKAVGCSECNYTGYNGRMGIFEVLLFDEDIQELVLKNPSISEIRRVAIEKGMITVRQDGLMRVLSKETTMEEINRVT